MVFESFRKFSMISLVNKNTEMENNPPKLSSNNNSQEAAELLGFSSSDSLDSPSFSHFQAPKQKRKVRFKKPLRSKGGRQAPKPPLMQCRVVEGAKLLSYFSLLALVAALLWYVISLSQRIQELQNKFADIEAGNRNTPEALHLQHSKLKLLESNVTLLYIEVRKNRADIDNMTLEVKRLREETNGLKESLAAAPALQELPKNVHALSESVVNFGSKMNALESNLKELKDQQANMATHAQNLSGDLEALKILVQELTNSSSEFQSKSSVNSSGKFQTAVQETSQQVHVLEGRLQGLVQSMHLLNSTLRDLPAKVDTLNEAIQWITNDTHAHHTLLSVLETFIDTNLTLRLEQLEAESGHSPVPSSIESINKTFELSHQNATELVKKMLQETFDALMATRDLKMQEMDSEIKHLTVHLNSDSRNPEADVTPPLFVLQSAAPKGGTTVPPV